MGSNRDDVDAFDIDPAAVHRGVGASGVETTEEDVDDVLYG
ncbi:hypothetical protein [Halocalculus aciditolerans]|nr:hypothetical protein [Halocalculus aciditolerans]